MGFKSAPSLGGRKKSLSKGFDVKSMKLKKPTLIIPNIAIVMANEAFEMFLYRRVKHIVQKLKISVQSRE